MLNRVVVDPEQGTVDSPLHPSQVEVYPWVPDALATLAAAGFALAVVTNQPAAAKGKTTRKNLEDVHARVLELACARGVAIVSSQICFHRAEDGCACRKPKPGMLEAAFAEVAGATREGSWMVGDGVTDVEAGARFGVRTAFFGPRKCDACKICEERGIVPDFWGKNLGEFAEHAKNSAP